MSTGNPSLVEIAFHEAGHAVAHHEQGIRFQKVSIEPDAKGESLGRESLKFPKWYHDAVEGSMSSKVPDLTKARLYMEGLVIGQMAGHLAQEKHAGKTPEFESYESDL